MKVVIIGAGVTGLVAALRLREANLDSIQEIVVIEKQSRPGGLLQSTTKNGYWWDNGAFKFGSSNYLANLFPEIFKEEGDRSVKVCRKAEFHKFPFSIADHIKSQSTYNNMKTAMNYIRCCAKYYFGSNPSHLHDWLRYRIPDRLLLESQLETYLKKVQGQDTKKLSPLVGEHRLKNVHNSTRPGRLIKTILKHAHGSKKNQKATTKYPFEHGVRSISLKLAEHCRNRDIKIVYNTTVRKIENKSTPKIYYDGKFGNGYYQADHVISTMPLNKLVKVLTPQVTEECLSFAESLAFMDMQLVFFIINRSLILNQCFTLYSFEEHHKWKRLIARSMQNGLSSIIVEVPFDPRNEVPVHDIIDRVSKDLTAELGLFEPNEILSKHSTVVHEAYPIYEIGVEKKVATIIQEVESDKFHLAGRQGLFQWVGTQKAIRTAIDAADKIIDGISNAR